MSTPEDTRYTSLEVDVDARLVEVWLLAWARDWWPDPEIESQPTELGGLLRLAYGCGYRDALREPTRGQLCRDHGLRVPDVVPTKKSALRSRNRDSPS